MTAPSIEVTMPQMGETVTEGTITQWLKQPGDRVEVDEPLVEVSTDKVDTEIPSPAAGVLVDVVVEEGETVPIGAILAHIADRASAGEDREPPRSADSPPRAPPPTADASPSLRRAGPGGTFLSPAVRRLVRERGVDPGSLTGSGEGGRVTVADVRAGGPRVVQSEPVPPPADDPNDLVVPFSAIRRRTAERLRGSLDTATHALVVMDADYTAVDRARRTANGLTFLPFVARAAVDAIAEFPHVNASVQEESLVVHRRVNLGIAVDLDFEGLVVPVVRDAADLRLPALARRMAELAARARAGESTPDDFARGTFTLTNAGGYGTLITGPIINHPEVAILSTDGVAMRPVAVPAEGGGYGVAVHPMGNLALSFDHRAFDGAYASAFLARVTEIIEDHDWSQELVAVST